MQKFLYKNKTFLILKTITPQAGLKSGADYSFKMLLRCPGKLEDQIAATGAFESHLMKLIPQFVKPDTVFLDIGANIGLHSLNVAAQVPSAKTLAFEPHPQIRSELNRNIEINKFEKKITAEPVAFGDHSGQIDFHVHSDQNFHNRGLSSANPEAVQAKDFTAIQVEMVTLDEYVQSKLSEQKISAIKIDTQGLEEAVLRGAKNTLKKHKPILFLELESEITKDRNQLFKFYTDLFSELNIDAYIIPKYQDGLVPLDFNNYRDRDIAEDVVCFFK